MVKQLKWMAPGSPQDPIRHIAAACVFVFEWNGKMPDDAGLRESLHLEGLPVIDENLDAVKRAIVELSAGAVDYFDGR